MSKVIDMAEYQRRTEQNSQQDEPVGKEVVIERTEEFFDAMSNLSAYLKSLDLTKAQLNEMVRLLVIQLTIAERNAFIRGYELGCTEQHDNR